MNVGPEVMISGAIAMGFGVATVFFLKFWRVTADRFFLAFAGAFALMSLNQALPALFNISREEQSRFYLLRLAAFVLIICAALMKNMVARKSRSEKSEEGT